MARLRTATTTTSPAFLFVMTTGLVNLFGDITYEGGASINGPFMATLGASAAIISVTAGLGEFLGYALRLPAGYAADRTGRYWLITSSAISSTCSRCRRWRLREAGRSQPPSCSPSGSDGRCASPPSRRCSPTRRASSERGGFTH